MTRLIAGLVLVAAVAAAGCGSSSAAKTDETPQKEKGEPPKGKDGKPMKGPDPG